MNYRSRQAFTFVEILVTLTLIAILFVPTMQFFSHAMDATLSSRDLITAVHLARWEMERTRNMASQVKRVRDEGNVVVARGKSVQVMFDYDAKVTVPVTDETRARLEVFEGRGSLA